MRLVKALVALAALASVIVPASVGAATAACGSTVSTPGVHTLVGDLDCGTGPGITIGADGVTLDLDGHRISGTGRYGVRTDGFDDTSIVDGRIARFSTGIDARNGTGLIVDGVDVVQVQRDGIRVESFLSVLVTDTRVMGPNSGSGIVAVDSEEVSIAASFVSRAGRDGIRMRNALDWAVRSTSLVDNDRIGLNIDGTPGEGFVVDVAANRNGLDGIRLTDAVPTTSLDPIVTITNANANGNGRRGIVVDGSGRVVVEGSSTIDNAGHGISVRSGPGGHTVRANSSRSNERDGLRIRDAGAVEVVSNRIERNGANGLRFDGTQVASRSNIAVANGRHGQAWSGAADGTSDFDRVQANAGDGFVVDVDASHTVVVRQARIEDNLASGLRSTSAGTVEADGGTFNDNVGSGIRIVAGDGIVDGVVVRRNGRSGVEYRSATGGSVNRGSMTGNGGWGLRIDASSSAVSFLNHLFAGNGLGGCSGCI